MSSRKESLKKSLGITEYPWSSDDDDDSTEAQPGQNTTPRTPTIDSRSSALDIPGTSGGQPHSSSPASIRKNQAKVDRDMFWSIVNNNTNCRPGALPRPSCSRMCDPPLSYEPRQPPLPSTPPAEIRRTERPVHSADVQRIVAFKKLTHSLNNLRQNRPSHGFFSMALRNPGTLRNTLFTPSSSSLSGSRANRAHSNRVSAQARSVLPISRASAVRTLTAPPPNNCRPRSDPAELDNHSVVLYTTPPPPPPPLPNDNDTPPLPEDEENNTEDGNTEESVNNSSNAVCLEEEIVEVDMPDEPDADADREPPVPMDDGDDDSGNNEPAPVTANSNTGNINLQPKQENQGVKRKRSGNDENGETYSIKAFNQNLLRLLECPVCLEWMEPPIAQCRRGHLVCARCRVRLVFCPVCRTTFSSVRNRAMEGVAEMLRYPCRHACGREVRLRRRAAHEGSCPARRYHCPAPTCAAGHAMHHDQLAEHFQSKHLPILKIGTMHKFSMRVHSEQHNTWIIMALEEFFYLRVDVDLRTWGIIVYVAFMGPKCNAKHYVYEVSLEGQHSSRKLVYTRLVHSDLESPSMNVSRQDCFHLTLDQALNFLRFKNRRCEDKYLDFNVRITKDETSAETREESDS